MATSTTRDYLVRLLEVILEERECARNLDMTGLALAMQAKEEIVNVLYHVKELEPGDRPIAARIRSENRRNAFLYKSALGWIRQTMEFFGQKTVTSTYSARACSVAAQVNGRLLSGRI
jgi:hypothetical protein